MTTKARLAPVAAAAAIVGIAAAIFVVRERSPRTVRIAGRTVGPGGSPLAGVRVTLEVSPSSSDEETAVERVETQSDAQGNFSINFRGHWRHASYRLEARIPGFEELSIEEADSLKSPVILRFSQSR
ncbi:MAG TPA: carboxypeptidase-like regulatory domain-containing protein [Thermoanaerobaculia bacterium]|nr:carboxypeptidase-like regulatory domain-containing protein [Thermoanaerobaculia bacterium]